MTEEMLAQLRGERNEIQFEIDFLKSKLEALDRLLYLFENTGTGVSVPVTAQLGADGAGLKAELGTGAPGTMKDAVLSALSPKPRHVTEIRKQVAATFRGNPLSRSFRKSVYNALYQLGVDGRAERVSLGYWAIKDGPTPDTKPDTGSRDQSADTPSTPSAANSSA